MTVPAAVDVAAGRPSPAPRGGTVRFRRLSPGLTIPELIRAERLDRLARCRLAARRLAILAAADACLAGAGLVLAAARVLLCLRLIEPACAAGAFGMAVRLTRAGLHRHRRARPASG